LAILQVALPHPVRQQMDIELLARIGVQHRASMMPA
jgi:hypothetical protein